MIIYQQSSVNQVNKYLRGIFMLERDYKNGYSKGNKDKFDNVRQDSSPINKITFGYSVCEGDLGKTITTLASRGASAHYIITQDGKQFQLHNDYMKTFYAGAGKFKGESVNETSINIILLNDAGNNTEYTEAQIEKFTSLVKELQAKHNISSENVIGLNEGNPGQPYSPGLLFPWDKLAEHGIGKIINLPEETSTECFAKIGDESSKIAEFQTLLANHGYPVQNNGIFDAYTEHYTLAMNIRYGKENSTCLSDKSFYIAQHLDDVAVVGSSSDILETESSTSEL